MRRSNAHAAVAAECGAVHERVGVADLTALAKHDVRGAGAETFLNRLCANRMPRRPGGIALAHMLTPRGRIECEVTVTRLADDHFFLLSAIAAQQHDLDWLMQHRRPGDAVTINDVTDEFGMLSLQGPRTRAVLRNLTAAPLDNAAFPWLCGRHIEVAGMATRALRVSCVGELGWELHHPIERIAELYAALQDAGHEFDIADFGLYAMNAMRMEKAYPARGAELTTEITPVEAGIMRFVKLDKDFIGREAVRTRRAATLAMQLVCCTVDTTTADCLGSEPAYAGDRRTGVVTSGAYGHTVTKVSRSPAWRLLTQNREHRLKSPCSASGSALRCKARRCTIQPRPGCGTNRRRLSGSLQPARPAGVAAQILHPDPGPGLCLDRLKLKRPTNLPG